MGYSENTQFDLVIIGGGPGGYVAAIKAAQLGMKVASIEKRDRLGGTCLNVGCIPSKSLLHSSHLYEEAKKHFSSHGIMASDITLNLSTMMQRKQKIVEDLGKGVDGLYKKNKISRFLGEGSIKSANEVNVLSASGETTLLQAKHILIATGSEPTIPSDIAVDEKFIVTSTGALNLAEVPEHMFVMGAGVIGLEMGTVWRSLGAKIEVIEFGDRICPFLDKECSKNYHRILEKQGLNFHLNTKVIAAAVKDGKVAIQTESTSGEKKEFSANILLVAIGRKPFTHNLGLEELKIEKDARGYIKVDKHFRTHISSIYAIGDVIVGPMLAHKAEEEAVAVVEMIAGQAGHVNYDIIPSVIYTHPEVASVGKTEEELKQLNITYKVGSFSFLGNSRARTTGDTDGFIKIIADASSDRVLGVHIIGPQAGEILQTAVMAMEYKASSEDIARICYSHPGLSEALKEAALATFSKAIHA